MYFLYWDDADIDPWPPIVLQKNVSRTLLRLGIFKDSPYLPRFRALWIVCTAVGDEGLHVPCEVQRKRRFSNVFFWGGLSVTAANSMRMIEVSQTY
jgi:hypothetical protein